MRFGRGDAGVTVGWAVIIASIFAQALFVRQTLTELDIVLLFLASAVAGAVLVDIETLVLSFVIAFGLSVVFAYFCLVLPSLLGLAGVAGEALYSAAIVMIFRSVFPSPFIFILLGGFLGSFIGEMLRLR